MTIYEIPDMSKLPLWAKRVNVREGWQEDSNINIDPCFVSSGHWDPNGTPDDRYDDIWQGGDFHLKAPSPCIDTGMNAAPEIPAVDFDGTPRIRDGNRDGTAVVDMGAVEFFPSAGALPGMIELLLLQ